MDVFYKVFNINTNADLVLFALFATGLLLLALGLLARDKVLGGLFLLQFFFNFGLVLFFGDRNQALWAITGLVFFSVYATFTEANLFKETPPKKGPAKDSTKSKN